MYSLHDALPISIYTVAAPWREPMQLPVTDGQVSLPTELQHSGALRILVWIVDPWVATELPRWPEPKGSTQCPAPGWFDAGDEEETALSQFLVGMAEFPTWLTTMRRLWTLIDGGEYRR